jgi:ATP-dependent RNA helicase RhlE
METNLNGRFGANYFKHDFDKRSKLVDYAIKGKLQTFDVLFDWYLREGSPFHLTGGLVYNGNPLQRHRASQPARPVHAQRPHLQRADVGILAGSIDYRKAAPYLGIGWGNALKTAAPGASTPTSAPSTRARPNVKLGSYGCTTGKPVCDAVVAGRRGRALQPAGRRRQLQGLSGAARQPELPFLIYPALRARMAAWRNHAQSSPALERCSYAGLPDGGGLPRPARAGQADRRPVERRQDRGLVRPAPRESCHRGSRRHGTLSPFHTFIAPHVVRFPRPDRPDRPHPRLARLHQAPTAVQSQAIPAVLAGRDVMAAAQTGTGKTAGFALPLLQRLTMDGAGGQLGARAGAGADPRTGRAGARERARYGAGLPLRTMVAYGGVSINPQMMKLRKGVDLLVATPGRLLDLHARTRSSSTRCRRWCWTKPTACSTSASRASSTTARRAAQARQTLLFSATFSDPIRALAGKLLRDPVSIEASPRNTTVKAIRQWIVPVDKKRKPELFLHLLKRTPGAGAGLRQDPQGRRPAGRAAGGERHLGRLDPRRQAAAGPPARAGALQGRRGAVLVATDVAARGLDIDELPVVVNFDLPIVAEDYVHRTGRTGRAGASGEAVSLVCADEVQQLAAIEVLTKQTLEARRGTGLRARAPGAGDERQRPDRQEAEEAEEIRSRRCKRPVVQEDVRFRR